MSDVGAMTTIQLTTMWKRAREECDAAPAFPFQLPQNRAAVSTAPPPVPVEPPAKRVVTVRIDASDWLARLHVTPEQAAAIQLYEQGSEPWLQSRVGRLTASNFGAASGVNKYTSPKALLKQMLWGEFKGNAATRYGSAHEDIARDEYIRVKRAEGVNLAVTETGLVINPVRPWMGNSPDGLIDVTHPDGTVERGLLEIKCPYRQQFYTPDPVPFYYFAQIQGTMGNLQLPWCDFVVWTPTGIQITRVPFDASYWETRLLPALTTFYFDMYVPLAVAKENGELEEGKTSLPASLIQLDF